MPDAHVLNASRRSQQAHPEHTSAIRPSFVTDADRLIFCSHTRRLTGKTQVHGDDGTDYCRDRLTHSLETASVARTLGHLCTPILEKAIRYQTDGAISSADPRNVGDLLFAAGLAHDIGHPPLGHAGEDTIQEWFRKSPTASDLLREIDRESAALGLDYYTAECRRTDFMRFNGNAQNMRILCTTAKQHAPFGLDLTAATKGALLKYPMGSATLGPYKTNNVTTTELSELGSLADELGLKAFGPENSDPAFYRPLTSYLLEAADTLCYTVADIADAAKERYITTSDASDLLILLAGGRAPRRDPDSDDFSDLSSHAIKALIEAAHTSFAELVDQWIASDQQSLVRDPIGSWPTEILLTSTARKSIIAVQSQMRTHVFNVKNRSGRQRQKEACLYELLEHQGQKALCTISEARSPGPSRAYETVVAMIDYIGGMTDRFMLASAQAILGNRQPRARG